MLHKVYSSKYRGNKYTIKTVPGYSSVPNTGYVTLIFFGKKFPSFGSYLVRNFYSFGKIVPPITIIKYVTFSKRNECPFIRSDLWNKSHQYGLNLMFITGI